ncbi:sulfatase [Haloferula sp.]|uniref:sulfatase family protein n=1 Tax=Haloferula sp. TaxID=2497595 RepID=UPI00329FA9EE
MKLKILAPLALLLTLVASRAADRPNIVFIFSDDHAWQAISAYGSNRNETPHIDRLADEGMRFDRCLVPNSICGPSRATVLTGTYNHINGFIDNSGCRFDGSQTTFPKLLQGAGYQTAIIGKWHLGSEPTGFDHWQVLPGQGQYYNPKMILNGENMREMGYVTDIITERSLDWLKKRDPERPFLLMCQHKAPHRNWSPNVTKLNHDGGKPYPEPPTLFDDYSGRGSGEKNQDMSLAKTMHEGDLKLKTTSAIPKSVRDEWNAYYGPRNEAFLKANLKGKDLIRWKYQRYMHDYLACISSVDDGIGEILDYLKESGLEENTIVVYASDQGFYLGEHGWFDKRWIFEESLRTPFLVRWPSVIKPASVSKEIVSNLDFAPTLLEAAGVSVPERVQGHSLMPLFKGQTPDEWRKSFYYHYYEFPGVHSVPRHYGVATDRYKLVHLYKPDDYWELFDLEKDPHEMKNVFDDPEYASARRTLEKELARLRDELKVPEKDPKGTRK